MCRLMACFATRLDSSAFSCEVHFEPFERNGGGGGSPSHQPVLLPPPPLKNEHSDGASITITNSPKGANHQHRKRAGQSGQRLLF